MSTFESQHPLVKHKIALLRDLKTSTKEFRELVNELGSLLAYEATANLALQECTINSWQGEVKCQELKGKKFTLVPILRAGLGMLEGFHRVCPNAKVSVVGMQRNEESLQAEEYYRKLAPEVKDRDALIIDPMLATGSTLNATIGCLKQAGCRSIRAIILIAAPEGIKKIHELHPEIDIYCGNIDERLNENGYIIPGLGDAGDRLFGTCQKF